jgi:hypothetical protein
MGWVKSGYISVPRWCWLVGMVGLWVDSSRLWPLLLVRILRDLLLRLIRV